MHAKQSKNYSDERTDSAVSPRIKPKVRRIEILNERMDYQYYHAGLEPAKCVCGNVEVKTAGYSHDQNVL